MKILKASLLVLTLTLLAAAHARATTLIVTNAADSGTGTLRDRVASAAANDTPCARCLLAWS